MPSGVYHRALSPTYRGFPRVRQVRSGGGSEAVCRVNCDTCGTALERTSRAIKRAQREGRGFRCSLCNVRRTVAIRRSRTEVIGG